MRTVRLVSMCMALSLLGPLTGPAGHSTALAHDDHHPETDHEREGPDLEPGLTSPNPLDAPDVAETLDAWREAATPGKEHRWLDELVGVWSTQTSVWTGDGDPVVSTGTSTIRWILGGRFLMEETSGSLLGQAHEALGILGYDKVKQLYVGFWIDSMSTGMYTSAGRLLEDGHTLRLNGAFDDAASGPPAKVTRYTLTKESSDTFVLSVHDLDPHHADRIMETTYTRKQ